VATPDRAVYESGPLTSVSKMANICTTIANFTYIFVSTYFKILITHVSMFIIREMFKLM